MSTAAWAFLGTVVMFLGTVATAAFAYNQSRRNAVTAPYGDMVQQLKDARERMDNMQGQIDGLRSTVRQAQDDARDRVRQEGKHVEQVAGDKACAYDDIGDQE